MYKFVADLGLMVCVIRSVVPAVWFATLFVGVGLIDVDLCMM